MISLPTRLDEPRATIPSAPARPFPSSDGPRRSQGAAGFRSDLQVLRAVAVLLVIANHLLGTPWAGFLGVDVFFVLSGFLITGHLLREQSTSGRIALVAFYRRRVKRLGPAALLVVLVTIAGAAVLFSTARFRQTATDGLFATVAGANWRFAFLGTDYMHASDAPSPFLHFWSLAVEEQFYVVWPLVVLVAVVMGRRLRRQWIGGAAIGAVFVASLGWSIWQTLVQPTASYFSTFSRAWELAAGALIAVAAPRLERLPAAVARALTWGGLALLGGGILLASDAVPFPAPGGLIAVVATAGIIAGGVPGRTPAVLRVRPLVYIGTISYSLYLWHYPAVVLLGQLFPVHGARYKAAVLVMTALLSVFSYHLVEAPLRRTRWTPSAALAGIRRARPTPRLLAFGALSVAIVVLAAGCFVFRQSPPVSTFPPGTLTTFTGLSTDEQGRLAQVDAAIASTRWPSLQPTPDAAWRDRAPQWVEAGCLGNDLHAIPDPVANAARCVFGDPDASRTMTVIGDSTAISYLPGLLAAYPTGWRFEVWTMSACSAADAPTLQHDGSAYPECDRFRQATFAHIRITEPDVVVAANSENSSAQMASGNDGAAVMPYWTKATVAALRAVAPHAGRVVVLDPPPITQDISACKTPISTPRDCVSGLNAHYVWTVSAQREAVAATALANVRYPNTLSWFCDASGHCPAFVDDTLIRADTGHLTVEASQSLAPLLRTAIDVEPVEADG